MILEPLGPIYFLAGLLILWKGPKLGFYLFCPATLLGAAAAIKLPAMGGASIQPAHLLLGFLAISILWQPSLRQAALKSLVFPNAGFWFTLFVVYGCISAFFLPRIFANLTYVFSLARYDDVVGIQILPLAPRSSNITQAAYLIGNFVCFAVVAAYARMGGGLIIARAIVVTAALCLVFAAADILTYATDTQDLLSFIRNANYRMLSDAEIGGFKRIVGSFSEAGAYSYAALGLYAFTLALWLEAYPLKYLGLLSALLLATILMSTSSTAYAAVLVFSLIVLLGCLSRSARGAATQRQISYIGWTFLVLPMVLMATMLLSGVWNTITTLFDATITNKLESQSGIERMLWNGQALVTFLDTAGLGAGVGSVRASSFIIALAASVGLPGAFLFGAFFYRLVRIPVAQANSRTAQTIVARAGGAACIALLIAATISAGGTDLGLFFSVAAGLASVPVAARMMSSTWPRRIFAPSGKQLFGPANPVSDGGV
jgi:hypothetical protein